MEHRQSFLEMLKSVKKNSKVVSNIELDAIKKCLKNDKKGSISTNINIVNRIKSNKFVLVNFPGAEDIVCVLKDKTKAQSVSDTNKC